MVKRIKNPGEIWGFISILFQQENNNNMVGIKRNVGDC